MQTNSESAINILLDLTRAAASGKKEVKMDDWAIRYPTNVLDVARVLVDLAGPLSRPPSRAGADSAQSTPVLFPRSYISPPRRLIQSTPSASCLLPSIPRRSTSPRWFRSRMDPRRAKRSDPGTAISRTCVCRFSEVTRARADEASRAERAGEAGDRDRWNRIRAVVEGGAGGGGEAGVGNENAGINLERRCVLDA